MVAVEVGGEVGGGEVAGGSSGTVDVVADPVGGRVVAGGAVVVVRDVGAGDGAVVGVAVGVRGAAVVGASGGGASGGGASG